MFEAAVRTPQAACRRVLREVREAAGRDVPEGTEAGRPREGTAKRGDSLKGERPEAKAAQLSWERGGGAQISRLGEGNARPAGGTEAGGGAAPRCPRVQPAPPLPQFTGLT